MKESALTTYFCQRRFDCHFTIFSKTGNAIGANVSDLQS